MGEVSEIWKNIRGCPDYDVSDFGRVRSRIGKGRILKCSPDNKGCPTAYVSGPNKKGRRYVSSLVLETFVGLKPRGMRACYVDGDKANTLLANLFWGIPARA